MTETNTHQNPTTDTPIAAPQLPQDLKTKLEAIEASSLTCSLLQKGMFHLRDAVNVNKVLMFHVTCYNAMLEEAVAHPDAHLDPELKEIIETRKKGNQDGTTQAQ